MIHLQTFVFHLQNIRSAKLEARFSVGENFYEGHCKDSFELEILSTAWSFGALKTCKPAGKESYSYWG